MTLYFAYGSNLHIEQMLARCPKATPVAQLALPNWRLEFKSVADCVPCRGAVCEGAVYEVTALCEKALDRYEGYPNLYRKEFIPVRIKGEDGVARIEPMMLYVMNREGLYGPGEGYLNVIAEGFKHWGIDFSTLAEAVDRAYEAEEAQQILDGEQIGLFEDDEDSAPFWSAA